MQNIINGIDKATKAGVFSLEEVLSVAKSIESLGAIVQQHNQYLASAKDGPSILEKSADELNQKKATGNQKEK